jgi:hypothetical protein
MFLGLFAWTYGWSVHFHVHETWLSERLDYISAIITWGAQVLSGFIIVFQVTSKKMIAMIVVPFVLRNGYFAWYMLFVK